MKDYSKFFKRDTCSLFTVSFLFVLTCLQYVEVWRWYFSQFPPFLRLVHQGAC